MESKDQSKFDKTIGKVENHTFFSNILQNQSGNIFKN